MKRKGLVFIIAIVLTLVFSAPPVMEAVAPEHAGSSVAYAATTASTTWNTNNWVRIPRIGYGDDVQVGKYYYYYENAVNSSSYYVYRENVNTGSTKRILLIKSTAGVGPEFYTNGEKLIYVYDNLGTMVKCKDLSTSKVKTIVNLRQYRTSKSTDTHLFIHIYGNYLYYSKYRGLSTTIWRVYKVNINTAKSYIIKKNMVIISPLDQENVSGRYFLVRDKNKIVKVLDTKDKTLRKLSGATFKTANPIDGYWYYVTSAKSGSTRTYNVWRKKMSGAGTAKKIAGFKKNYPPDQIIELTAKALYFFRDGSGNGYTMKYRFDTKKFVKLASRDVWYYISKNQRFL